MSSVEEREQAVARLVQRGSSELAAFIMTLIDEPGPIGDYVRAFIAADDAENTVSILSEGIRALRGDSHTHRRSPRDGIDLVNRASRLLDAIEYVVLPLNGTAAFNLLVQLIEFDRAISEQTPDADFEVQQVFGRATKLFSMIAAQTPGLQVQPILERLRAQDDYGLRCGLREVRGAQT